MKDDGFGIHVIEKLKGERLEVEIVDAMTDTNLLLSAMDGKRKAIIVDAMDFDGDVGEVRVIRLNPERVPFELNLTSHDLHFKDVLAIAKDVYRLPEEIVIIGVKPKEIKPEIGLSEELERKIDEVVKLIKEEVTSFCTSRKRSSSG